MVLYVLCLANFYNVELTYSVRDCVSLVLLVHKFDGCSVLLTVISNLRFNYSGLELLNFVIKVCAELVLGS